ncbi:MAG: hypothetical protein HWD59_07805 [Coxiellaceae bacterium]|nr:MAG: hypothetical protein HWD59_07805 [Coxiellaceae bacterium]
MNIQTLGSKPSAFGAFKLYVFLLEKRQKEKTNTPTPYTAQLLFGKDCFIDKIKALIIADHSTEFQEFIQSTDQSSFELIKEEYGLNDSKLMTKYEQILASVTTATNSLVNTFRNFQSSFIFPFWKKSPAATQISAPYNCGGPFNKYFPVSKIPENFKSSKFEPLDYAEEAFLKELRTFY